MEKSAALQGWGALPERFMRLLADLFLADNDLDRYMDLRAVCSGWRRGAAGNPGDPRFQPKVWAVMQKLFGREDCVVSMVNLKTGRFVRKEIPLLSKYRYINATDGGLLVLWEGGMPPWLTFRALVSNPFTGSKAYFVVPITAWGLRAVAVDTSPLMLYASNLSTFVGRAGLDSQHFQLHRVHNPEFISDMRLFRGHIYAVTRHESSTAPADAIGDGRSAKMKPTAIQVALKKIQVAAPAGDYYHLVESAGELLLVIRPSIAGQPVLVHKVDTVNMVLEPVASIGSHALFIGQVRSFSIDTSNKQFPTVEAGCIYFVESLYTVRRHGFIASSIRLMDQRRQHINVAVRFGFQAGHHYFGPATLVEALGDHCRYTPEHELERYHDDVDGGSSKDYHRLDDADGTAAESVGSN